MINLVAPFLDQLIKLAIHFVALHESGVFGLDERHVLDRASLSFGHVVKELFRIEKALGTQVIASNASSLHVVGS